MPHRDTTDTLRSLYPFITDRTTGSRGAYIGFDSHNQSFYADSWEWYAQKLIGSPSWLVLGDLSWGKSSLVKAFAFRQYVYGRWTMILDVKGEYAGLARAMDSEPIFLKPGGNTQVNPFPLTATKDEHEALILAVASAAIGQPLSSGEKTACTVALNEALRTTSELTLPLIVDKILWPEEGSAEGIGYGVTRETLAQDGRAVGLELNRFCRGHLRGMFDGPTTRGIRTDSPCIVLDLSDIYNNHRDALQIAMRLADGWFQSAVKRDQTHGIYVVEEAWGLLSDLSVAKGLQGGYKLSRRTGVQYISVMHGLSDIDAAGDEGTTTRAIAQGLVRDSGVKIIYHQPKSEAEITRRILGLSYAEANLLPYLGKGTALWRLGERSKLVRHRMSALEADICNTDERMK